jgi:uncharacterized repeat protein (TIGR03803 family)
VLHRFAGGKDGGDPETSLILDAAGNLYGTTRQGGGSTNCRGGCGTVFKLTPNADGSWTERVLHSFSGADGNNPRASLIFDTAGTLYGTTIGGGSNDRGTVFKLTSNTDGTWTESVVYSFTGGADGCAPWANLIFDAGGNLYGTTTRGGIIPVSAAAARSSS